LQCKRQNCSISVKKIWQICLRAQQREALKRNCDVDLSRFNALTILTAENGACIRIAALLREPENIRA